MRSFIRAATLALLLLFATAGAAQAAAKTFTVLPFAVNGPAAYKYLEQSIPQMFTSRLYWAGQFESKAQPDSAKRTPPADEKAAEAARAAVGADYVIWGSVTIVGENCSLDVRVRDKAGKSWPLSRDTTVPQLIPVLKQTAGSINDEVFKRPRQGSQARAEAAKERVNQMNPGLVRNQNTPSEVYMNPQFRYSGQNPDESRLRSQILPFASRGMEICDADGDGRNEVFLLTENKVMAYRFETDRLVPLAQFDMPVAQYGLSIRSIDLHRTGRPVLVINSKAEKEDPYVRILSFDGKKLKEEFRGVGLYANVVYLPPLFRPQLVVQRTNPPHLFLSGIYEAVLKGGKVSMGTKLANLPEKCNLFNFAYVPAGKNAADGMKVVMLTEDENLRLYSEKGARLSQSPETYSGSFQGIYVDAGMPGMGEEHVTRGQTYYIPMRILVVDLDNDGNHEIIVNKPISTASAIFTAYRAFPQSEIHALQWDGVGLGLVWKTRRIKGGTADYAISDLNNDGIPDLVVCVNTHPGALGAEARKTIVLAYPLDLSQTDPRTLPSTSE